MAQPPSECFRSGAGDGFEAVLATSGTAESTSSLEFPLSYYCCAVIIAHVHGTDRQMDGVTAQLDGPYGRAGLNKGLD